MRRRRRPLRFPAQEEDFFAEAAEHHATAEYHSAAALASAAAAAAERVRALAAEGDDDDDDEDVVFSHGERFVDAYEDDYCEAVEEPLALRGYYAEDGMGARPPAAPAQSPPRRGARCGLVRGWCGAERAGWLLAPPGVDVVEEEDFLDEDDAEEVALAPVEFCEVVDEEEPEPAGRGGRSGAADGVESDEARVPI